MVVDLSFSFDQQDNDSGMIPFIVPEGVPIFVLCGPPASGKSMMLKSLHHYIWRERIGEIMANRTLLNTPEYQENCNLFKSIIEETNTPMPNTVNYLMADIVDNLGNVKAHFIDTPGGYFYNPNNLEDCKHRFIRMIEQLHPTKRHKIVLVLFLEPQSDTYNYKKYNEYLNNVIRDINRLNENGYELYVMFVYSKIDLEHEIEMLNNKNINKVNQQLKHRIMSDFPNLKNLFPSLWKRILNRMSGKDKYYTRYSLLSYSSGYFDGDFWSLQNFCYPKMLFEKIIKLSKI